ncbi:MAG: tRNA (adenosine(37)-N6)-threonylcarbamoyltransferase complex ATPase subunit type 1 TsaE [Bacteroidota bacterium]
MEQLFAIEELDLIASQLAALTINYKVLAFHGEMGAGKTTLISALCKALESSDIIGSPTFSIINQYETANGSKIYHMDWYRLRDEEEAIEAGVEDALYSGNVCLVEWPEKAPGLLPNKVLHVHLETVEPSVRSIRLQKST